MGGVLEGIRIAEMGHVVAVPAATATLADWGADVIKIEPLTGDMARGFKRILGVDTVAKGKGGGANWYVELLNRNKKSLAVDLKTGPGREIIYRLIGQYDVFIANYEQGSLKRLKMDYDSLRQHNPKLIYGVLTAYGSKGPDKDQRGLDWVAAWARGGAQYLIGELGSPPPPQRGGMMDRVTGAHIVSGLLAAMLHREKTGEGQALEFSLYQAAVWTLAEDIQSALAGTPLPRWDRTKAGNPMFNSYRAGDGHWLQLAIASSDVQWADFCRAIEMPGLEKDPRFTDMDKRSENCMELIRMLDEVFAGRTRDEWEKRLREGDFIYGRIQSPGEVTTDPQAIANDFFAELDHPAAGPMKLVNTPVKFRQDPASVRAPAPEVGQHTEEILLDLDYGWEDIAQLKEQGVIL